MNLRAIKWNGARTVIFIPYLEWRKAKWIDEQIRLDSHWRARDLPVPLQSERSWSNCVFVLENWMNSNECVYKSIPWISANFLWWSWRCCAPDRIPKHQISSFNGITNDYSQSKLVSFRRLIQLSHGTRIADFPVRRLLSRCSLFLFVSTLGGAKNGRHRHRGWWKSFSSLCEQVRFPVYLEHVHTRITSHTHTHKRDSDE